MTGPELRAMRIQKGLTQSDLARKLFTHQTRILRWEQGKKMIDSSDESRIRTTLSSIPDVGKEPESIYEIYMAKKLPEKLTEARDEKEVSHTVELGPETMRAIKDLVMTAVRELSLVMGPVDPLARIRREEVSQSARDGAEYRRKTQEILGRGY
jgi:transcriptional regulator with XRE-family HTH domain